MSREAPVTAVAGGDSAAAGEWFLPLYLLPGRIIFLARSSSAALGIVALTSSSGYKHAALRRHRRALQIRLDRRRRRERAALLGLAGAAARSFPRRSRAAPTTRPSASSTRTTPTASRETCRSASPGADHQGVDSSGSTARSATPAPGATADGADADDRARHAVQQSRPLPLRPLPARCRRRRAACARQADPGDAAPAPSSAGSMSWSVATTSSRACARA